MEEIKKPSIQTNTQNSKLVPRGEGEAALRSRYLTVAVSLFVSLSFGFLGGWLGAKNYHLNSNSAGNTAAGQQVISSESKIINDIAKNVGESVVSISVTSRTTQSDLFGFEQALQRESAGTGFIISKEGVIATNRHVVPKGSTTVDVTLSDGTEFTDVEVVGRTNEGDPLDVAFLKIKDKKGKNLRPVKLADSGKVKIGDRVVAIGNALGQFQNTVTEGIISGHGRNVQAGDGSGNSEQLQDLFQTDAAINQGNSGGPLVNLSGEVIGINTAVAGDAQNIGFAIPINDIKGLIASVLEQGKLLRPYLGVRYVSLTDDYAFEHNLSVKRGAYVVPSRDGSSVVDDSPAAKTGLKEKDVIVKVNNDKIDENNSLTSVLGRHKVGETVTLEVQRGKQSLPLKATLAAAPVQ